jgi:cell wall-associated NlpC family hydrolase
VALTQVLGRVRKLIGIAAAVVAVVVTAVVVPKVAGASPVQPGAPSASTAGQPAVTPSAPTSVEAVQARLAALAKQNEVITEQFNLAQAGLSASKAAAETAQRLAAKAQAVFRAARAQFGSTVAAQYEQQSFSGAGALLNSDSGQDYLDRVSQMTLLAQHRLAQVSALSAIQTAAARTQARANALVVAAQDKQGAVAKQQAAIEADTKKFTSLLATLTVAQQLAFQNRRISPAQLVAEVAGLPVKAPNVKAQLAVDYAKAQIGKWYRFAAAGPTLYDCSGLTMMAWAAAGVSLPHNADAQSHFGANFTSLTQLQPGDLIFLYRPISHVEIYVGNFLAISAPEEGEQVQYVDVRTLGADFTSATRL